MARRSATNCCMCITENKRISKIKPGAERPPDTRKHTVLPVSIRLKSTEKTPACVSMWAFLQPISARIYFGKTASHRKRARLVQSRGASPQAYWMSVKAAQRRGCAKRAFCGVCFLMPGGLSAGLCCGAGGGRGQRSGSHLEEEGSFFAGCAAAGEGMRSDAVRYLLRGLYATAKTRRVIAMLGSMYARLYSRE